MKYQHIICITIVPMYTIYSIRITNYIAIISTY